MTEDLQIAIIQQSQAAEDPVQFWAEAFGIVAGFAQEHIGSAITAVMLRSMAGSVEDDIETEDKH